MKTAKKDYEMEKEIRPWSSFVPKETSKEVSKILKSGWINTGIQEKLLRQNFSKKFNIKYCVATNSGTSSLRLSLAALGIGLGDEVISTPYTFIATNTSILEQGAKPVFADIQYNTLNIDPDGIAKKITKKTKAIMCVHYGGNPCDMDEIRAIGKKYNIPIIEDSAHAIGSKYKGDYIGSKGDIVTFSLQVIKIITSGDGGLVATPNKQYYELLEKLSWYGVGKERKVTSLIDPFPDKIEILGFKYNMNDIAAAIGLVGLKHINESLSIRKKIGELYRREFANCSKVKLLHYDKDKTPNYQIFPIHVKNRLKFAKYMRNHSIVVNVNNRRNDRYSIFGGLKNLPNLERADEDVILLPIHCDLTGADLKRIIESVKNYDKI